MRVFALISGIAGAVIGFVINILNSSLRFVGQITGFTDTGGHIFIGTMVSIVAAIAAILALIVPEVAAILLILCAIGYFFAIGWWALIPAIFLLLGAWFAMRGRAQRQAVAT